MDNFQLLRLPTGYVNLNEISKIVYKETDRHDYDYDNHYVDKVYHITLQDGETVTIEEDDDKEMFNTISKLISEYTYS